jgi:hypothetical protein
MVRNASTRICGVADEKCFRKIEENFDQAKGKCECLQSCYTVKYDVQAKKLSGKM